MNSKTFRRIVDIAMTAILPFLMAYSLIGEMFHEIIGTVMIILMVIHLIQNRRWLAAIPKGRYNARRVFQTVLDIVLLIAMVLQPLSGILMSKYLFTFIRISGIAATARGIHMALAYWCLILMSMHAGTHMHAAFVKLWKKKGAKRAVPVVMLVCICLYGAYAFVKRQIPSYMFLQNQFAFFDYRESRILFIWDYLSVMILFAVIGMLIIAALSAIKRTKPA